MKKENYTHSFEVDKQANQVFAALTNVHAWWGEGIKGKSEKPGDSFFYKHKEFHTSRQTLTELIPNKKLVWDVTDSKINFVQNKSEWENTKVIFDIVEKGKKTTVTITHSGLTPKLECYDGCSGGWNQYFGESLKKLIETGKGSPDPKSFSD